ncbi:MAG: universal stress protein [Polyangiaceae bacterium]
MSADPIQHILVPHDFSETAEHALEYALALASRLGAKVTILHTYEVVSYGYAEGIAFTADMVRELERAARATLEGVAVRARRKGVEVGVELRQGSPWVEILAFAEQSRPDLIVMGTHGRKGFTRMLLGSVTDRVLRAAPCPVLAVRDGGAPK